ncbi:hypothetical protein HUU53_04420 [Candidatus Micrarchaeota archaeon]|nr:hypothetical protein [Candidatus Micrarchaeota archaeon]
MNAMEVGRKCVVLTGRRAGMTCTIKKVVDNNFVEVELDAKKNASKDAKGKKVRKMNKLHLEPLK